MIHNCRLILRKVANSEIQFANWKQKKRGQYKTVFDPCRLSRRLGTLQFLLQKKRKTCNNYSQVVSKSDIFFKYPMTVQSLIVSIQTVKKIATRKKDNNLKWLILRVIFLRIHGIFLITFVLNFQLKQKLFKQLS